MDGKLNFSPTSEVRIHLFLFGCLMTVLVPAVSVICQVDPALSSELPTQKSSYRLLKLHSHLKLAEISMDD